MKRLFYLFFALLCSCVLVCALPVEGEEGIYRHVIRLHVLAASDSEEDQAHKLAVRDAVLSEYGYLLSECTDMQEAIRLSEAVLEDMKDLAEATLRDRGCNSTVKVTLTEEEYPTRDYGTFALPAGKYTSLRILIGEAEGQNWWCVLYPPLCLSTATDAGDTPVGLTQAEYGLMTENGKGNYTVKFRILEVLKSWFS